MTVIYHESDANPAALTGRRISILGYGNLGRALALNLRDSGLEILIGNTDDEYAEMAREDRFEVTGLAEAAALSDVKFMVLPDEIMPEMHLKCVAPSLRADDMLIYTSGFNVAFGFIEPPPFVDVVMVAPRTVGSAVRDRFLAGSGFLSFVSVAQDHSGKAWDQLLALAQAMGTLRAGAVEINFRQEAELDLFVQHTILPSVHNLITTAGEMLIKEGYPPEAVFLDLYISGELSYMLAKASEIGLMNTLKLYAATEQYGLLSRIERFQDQKIRRQLETALEEIRSGKFSQEWANEYANAYTRLNTLRQKRNTLTLWDLEQQALEALSQNLPSI